MGGEEPWDELMGPPPSSTASRQPPSTPPPPPPATTERITVPTMIRTSSSSPAPPPPSMFRSSSSNNTSNSLNASGSAIALPRRSTATSKASTGSKNSSFDDDDIQDEGSSKLMINNRRRDNKESEDNDNDSIDSDIGREYDEHVNHDSIRQEALRMLEVADADSHYSVHRTITGGFTAQAKSFTTDNKRTKSALQALNYTAQRSNSKRFSGYTTSSTTRPKYMSDRDDMEYGESSNQSDVVDMMGIEARSAGTTSTDSGTANNNWSSRYSIDNTLLAMTGGTSRPWSSTYDTSYKTNNSTERMAASNLFSNSPIKSTQIFGSGFQFRQQHVFGKQHNVERNIHADGIFKDGNDSSSSPMNNTKLKTWQEQLIEKKRQQRRCILVLLFIVLCTVIPVATVMSARDSNKNLSTDNNTSINGFGFDSNNNPNGIDPNTIVHDEVILYVTANVPYTSDEESDLQTNFNTIINQKNDAHFIVHVGNIHDTETSDCDTATYNHVADFLESVSPDRPVFVVPGENDWNNCPDPDDAWDAWFSAFELYDERWGENIVIDGVPTTVYREKYQLENWAFLMKGVLFIGTHVVNGYVPDETEFDERNHLNVEWVKGLSKQHEAAVRAVVVFGNAQPGHEANNNFFAHAATFWHDFTKPILYVHSEPVDSRNTYDNNVAAEFYHPFEHMKHVWGVQLDKAIHKIPLRIEVGLGDKPFTVGQ